MKKKCELTARKLRALDPCCLEDRLAKFFAKTKGPVDVKLAIRLGATLGNLVWVAEALKYDKLLQHYGYITLRRNWSQLTPLQQDAARLVKVCLEEPRNAGALQAVKDFYDNKIDDVLRNWRNVDARGILRYLLRDLRYNGGYSADIGYCANAMWNDLHRNIPGSPQDQDKDSAAGFRAFVKACDDYDQGRPPASIKKGNS